MITLPNLGTKYVHQSTLISFSCSKSLLSGLALIQEAHAYCFDIRKQVKMYQTFFLKETVLSYLVIDKTESVLLWKLEMTVSPDYVLGMCRVRPLRIWF